MIVTGGDICLILVTILLPPLAVFFMTGCSADLCINILLTLLGYIPGHIHAFWLIYRRIKARSRYGEGGYVCKCIELMHSIHFEYLIVFCI
ncbi:hypothetical protein M407DRAFT_65434 [Tulasnella calospora MUT 4182]|uniref:Stress response RCI peptide n=1 Tax=Tulasnella calospora MUT 4182 TaxID=1051891 RepID=A0A0C3MIR0_9AGAM|nr:hypothetical protein M407DRAFT_65434 [Tulasnella calospora MUT 4182]